MADGAGRCARRGPFINPRRGRVAFGVVAESGRRLAAGSLPKTHVGYQSILNRHVLPVFASSRVAAIASKDVQDFANDLRAELAPNTVRRIMDVVRGILSLAVVRRHVPSSPVVGVS